MAKSFLNTTAKLKVNGVDKTYPLGLRNNNPGNLRRLNNDMWQGEVPYAQSKDANFSQFYELRYGLRAMMKNIYGYYTRYGLNTIADIIGKYAPPNENNTKAYIGSVAIALGISAAAPFALTYDALMIISKAVVRMELGAGFSDLITDTDYVEAFNMSGINLKKKKV